MKELSFVHRLVRNSEFLSSFTATGSKHTTAIFRSHTTAEPMLISSFSYGRLKCSFHDLYALNAVFSQKFGLQR